MKELLDKLRAGGYKVTPRRKAIIELFSRKGGTFSPQDVQEVLKERIGKCGLPGVYRNLETLASCGVLFRIADFGGERRYALCGVDTSEGHHHHIVCVSCGKVGKIGRAHV